MSWLTWRQHRLAGVTALLLLAAVAVPVVISGLAMREAYQQLGIAACAGHTDARCTELLAQFSGRYRGWGQQLLRVAQLRAGAGRRARRRAAGRT